MGSEAAQWAGMNKVRELLREILRPNPPNEDFPAPLIGAEPVGVYERKTQAPVVWLNLRKSKFPTTATILGRAWYHEPYAWCKATLGCSRPRNPTRTTRLECCLRADTRRPIGRLRWRHCPRQRKIDLPVQVDFA